MKVAVSGAIRLRECKNTEFVWELSKGVFCEGAVRSHSAREGCRKFSCDRPLTGM